MKLQFDLERVKSDDTEFYAAIGRGRTPNVGFVRIGNDLRNALNEATVCTVRRMQELSAEPEQYDPANIHESAAHLFVPMDSGFASKAKYLHEVSSPDELTDPLKQLPKADLYMARLEDEHGNRLTAVKKTSDFGRKLKRGLLAKLADGGLELDDEPKFQLSGDFDFLIEDQGVFVYRYRQFESACNLDTTIKDAAKDNLAYIKTQVTFLDFDSIEQTATTSVRSARVIASIRANNYGARLDIDRIRSYCNQYDIPFSEEDGVMTVEPTHHLDFLRLVGRQILGVELVPGEPEVFQASSRKPYR